MKRRNFIKNSGFAFGSTLLVSNLVSVQGAFALTVEGCIYELAPVGIQMELEKTYTNPNFIGTTGSLEWHNGVINQLSDMIDAAKADATNGVAPWTRFLDAGYSSTEMSLIWEWACDGKTNPVVPAIFEISAHVVDADGDMEVTVSIQATMATPQQCFGESSPGIPAPYDGPGSRGNPGCPPGHQPPAPTPSQWASYLSYLAANYS